MLATMKHASESLDDPSLDEAWRACVQSFDWESVMPAAPSDVLTGVTGLGLSLTSKQQWIDQLPIDLRETLGTIASDETVMVDAVLPPGASKILASLPSERVGRLLLCSRLGIDDESDLQRRIAGIISSEPTLGELLGLIALSVPEAPWWQPLRDRVTDAFDERGCSSGRLQQMDAAELALAMWQSSQDTIWLDRARALGDRWISEFNSSGSWFPADLADDRFRLSIVWGLPAVASLLFRIGGAPTVASPRLLDLRAWKV